MFGFVKPLLKYRIACMLIIIAVVAKLYQKDLLQLIQKTAGSYLDTTVRSEEHAESVAVEFNADPRGVLFTPAQLATYNGEKVGGDIYLALLGAVFDVSRGLKHYGPGCSYNYFAGRDASVSFVSGQFEHYDPETADDVLSLQPNNLIELDKWRQFYETEYKYVGRVIGRFYDETGKSTVYHQKYLALLEQAQLAKAQIDELRNRYPGCNIEWSEARGTRVWCTTTSGDGQLRDWTGYPRKLYNRDKKNFHCACVPEAELNDPIFKSYDNCAPLALECFYRV
ncbi:neuferricin homolog [Drosophila grimshawi]|uniref:GH17751 n=1 Tax=Drosophila grimshawi TaxID=7222 RepID=B4JXL0_DROGR|nr:neuferricin homolog [Drosophila grimshawi]EDV95109.1 GH17751 [Drosophila grimshawi]